MSNQSMENLPSSRLMLRQVPFSYAEQSNSVKNDEPSSHTNRHWNKDRPEFSQIVNAASLAMPYLEPFLIRSMREARPEISDPVLQRELDLYIVQEATHSKQHKKFNKTISDAGYTSVAKIERTLASDYKELGVKRSLRFKLAYAEGFESMALAIGHMLIEDRVYLFGNSDSNVASLILWHFVEEIEHKNVAFDVFEHLYGSYFWRMAGLFYATTHIFLRTGQGYRALLREDGLWRNLKSRWRLTKVLLHIFRRLLPKLARILKPGYHPSQVTDPQWGDAWSKLYNQDPILASQLDTTRFNEALPVALPG